MQRFKHYKLLLRGAARLHWCYQRRRRSAQRDRIESLSSTLSDYLNAAYKVERQLSMALRRDMAAAAAVLTARYDVAIRDLLRIVEAVHHRRSRAPALAMPQQHDLFEELIAVEDEFGNVEINLRDDRISATTEAITLEGVPLGRFRIDLLLDALAGTTAYDWYQIEALEPNPPSCNEDVTHPHVDSGRLCAGNAVDAIEQALMGGRLSEFFLLVRSVLRNYNPNSPYVELERWDGVSCHDCGYVTDTETSSYCRCCEQDFCEECIDSCTECSDWLCRGCLIKSDISDALLCESCSAKCAECGGTAAKSHLTAGICSVCHEQLETSEEDEEDHHVQQEDSHAATTTQAA